MALAVCLSAVEQYSLRTRNYRAKIVQIIFQKRSDVASGWAGWTLAHPEFGSSVNPIPTRGADYAHHITACPPGFENLTASLNTEEKCLKSEASSYVSGMLVTF